MQQAWSLMVKERVEVKSLTELQDHNKDSIAFLDIPVDTGNLRIYAMPKGVEWPLGTFEGDDIRRFLIVRPCWLKLWDVVVKKSLITESPGVIINGTRDIGKSWFVNFMLLQRAEQATDLDTTLLHSGKELVISTFVGKRVESVATEQILPRHLARAPPGTPRRWYLYDPPDGEAIADVVQYHAFLVISASPNPVHHKALYKGPVVMLFMQPWSLEELQAVRGIMVFKSRVLSADDVKERFDKCGGVPRHIFTFE